MAEIAIVEAIDGAQLVKAEVITGIQYIQVWHGGTQVSVFCPETQYHDTWSEVTVWSISDDKGRPVEEEKIVKHMKMHFERVRESLEHDVKTGERE
jgi:hypothetical protein